LFFRVFRQHPIVKGHYLITTCELWFNIRDRERGARGSYVSWTASLDYIKTGIVIQGSLLPSSDYHRQIQKQEFPSSLPINSPPTLLSMKAFSISKTKSRFGFPNTGAIMGFQHVTEHITNRTRNDMVATLGEFAGTFLFLFFAFAACQVANTPPAGATEPTEPSTLRIIYIGLGFSVSLAINCWLFYRVSGGQFNPAVSTCATFFFTPSER